MKAIFLTTDSVDCFNHVRAWNSCFPEASHWTYNVQGVRNDWQAIEASEGHGVIFYIGAVKGMGVPKPNTFRELRKIAPLINLCSDAADRPWHEPLRLYKPYFDLQVAIDGAKNSPADFSTLTPVDPHPFNKVSKDIRCGFSGTVGRWHPRSDIVKALEWFGGLTVRHRDKSYEDHVDFMSRCKMILNTSWTGTGHAHHIKGRVIEAGLSGAALIENVDSPIGDWFSKDCYFTWSHPKEVAEIIKDSSDEEIKSVACNLSKTVKERYTAKQIYGEILNNVDITFPQSAA